ncbi:MAG: hypothetical protein HND58_04465 [Planctomycetota bacterium]|nr:MAG: hypothetical protein HND58_04465 [Planctomycetota bacterium]
MSRKRAKLTGLAELLALASRAKIPRNEKAVLKALVQLANWDTGEGIWACVSTIGKMSGYKRRQAGLMLNALERRGLIVFVHRSAGGNGCRHRINIEVRRLRQLASADERANESGDLSPEPELRIQRQSSAHSAAINCARSAHDQGETKNTTTPPQPPEAQSNAGRSTEPPARGGVGTTLDERERAARMLLRQGVWSSTAEALSQTNSPSVIASAIKLVDEMPRPPKDRGAMIVHKLRSGDAQRRHETAELNVERGRERERMHERARRARLMQVRLRGFRGTPEAAAIMESLRVVSSVWPTDDAVAKGAPVSDEDLGLADTAPVELLRILEEAALEHRARYGVGHEAHRRVGAPTQGAS